MRLLQVVPLGRTGRFLKYEVSGMAEQLSDYEFNLHRAGVTKYPWKEWTNGSAWRIKRGEDFASTATCFRNTLYDHALRHGLKVSTRLEQEDVLVFQFSKNGETPSER